MAGKPKKKDPIHTVKCECNRCGDIAFVIPGNEHFTCRGFDKAFTQKATKALLNRMKSNHPKGIWMAYVKTGDSLPPLQMEAITSIDGTTSVN